MYVIRLPNGNLQVPQTAIRTDGHSRMIGDAYVEIGPRDADYARLVGDQDWTGEEEDPGAR